VAGLLDDVICRSLRPDWDALLARDGLLNDVIYRSFLLDQASNRNYTLNSIKFSFELAGSQERDNMRLSLRRLAAAGSIAAFGALPGVAFSQVDFFSPQEGVNAIFVGVGSAPDFMGSDKNETVPAVFGRYNFQGTRRYIQLLGPQLSLNLINSESWQFGPQIAYRAKRDSDVDNPVVARMRTVDSETEFGVFVARTWQLSNDPRHRFNLRADLQSGEGEFGTVTANFWMPVSNAVVLNFGGGFAYASGKWTNNYFGVNGTDIALFPTLGGRAYNAGSGVYDFRVNAGAVLHMSREWHIGAGVRYQRLQGDAADSPIVTQQGNKDQYIFGAAIGYAWK